MLLLGAGAVLLIKPAADAANTVGGTVSLFTTPLYSIEQVFQDRLGGLSNVINSILPVVNSNPVANPINYILPPDPISVWNSATAFSTQVADNSQLMPSSDWSAAYPGYEQGNIWDTFRLGWNVSPLGGLWALQ